MAAQSFEQVFVPDIQIKTEAEDSPAEHSEGQEEEEEEEDGAQAGERVFTGPPSWHTNQPNAGTYVKEEVPDPTDPDTSSESSRHKDTSNWVTPFTGDDDASYLMQDGGATNGRGNQVMPWSEPASPTAPSKSRSRVKFKKKRQCRVCGKQFRYPFQLKTHVVMHSEVKPYSCDSCLNTFSQKGHLQRHIQSVHLRERNYNCEKCGRHFGRSQHLQIHLATVHHIVSYKLKDQNKSKSKRKARKYKCPTCSKRYQYPFQLKRHNLSHSNIKPYTCDICGNSFVERGSLQIHMESLHLREKSHDCDKCGRQFNRPDHLQKHMVTHDEKPALVCEICNKRYVRPRNLLFHLKSMHDISDINKMKQQHCETNIPEFVCHICDKTFGEARKLRIHISRVHLGEKRHECELCGKQFFASGTLKQHIATVHNKEKKHKCLFCDKAYSHRGALVHHEAKEHRVKTHPSKHLCPVCKKQFSSADILEAHRVRNHTECYCDFCKKSFRSKTYLTTHVLDVHRLREKRYRCEICPFTAAIPSHIKRHMAIHSSVQPHACMFCIKSYKHLAHLKLHIKKEHVKPD